MDYLTKYEEQIHLLSAKLSNKYISYDTQMVYKKGKDFKNVTNSVLGRDIEIEFYTAKTIFEFDKFRLAITFEGKLRTLSVTVIFDNEKNNFENTFCDLSNVFSYPEFRNPNSGYLYDHQRLDIAFGWLSSILLERIDEIADIAKNEEIFNQLEVNFNLDVLAYKKRNNKQQRILNGAYACFLCNDYKKAIKIYENLKDKLTTFETNLLSFMQNQIQSSSEKDFIAILQEINTVRIDKDIKKRSLSILLAVYMAMPVCFVLGSIPFLAVYFIFKLIVGDLVVMAPFVMAMIPGVFAGIILCAWAYRPFLKLILKSKYEEYINIEKIKTPKWKKKFTKYFYSLTLVTCTLFMFFCLRWNVIFKDDYFIDNSKFFFPTGQHIKYEEVEGFYKINAFKNDMGGIYNEPSYALKLKNGNIIDFRPVNDPNRKTISFLEIKLGEIKNVDFIQDLK